MPELASSNINRTSAASTAGTASTLQVDGTAAQFAAAESGLSALAIATSVDSAAIDASGASKEKPSNPTHDELAVVKAASSNTTHVDIAVVEAANRKGGDRFNLTKQATQVLSMVTTAISSRTPSVAGFAIESVRSGGENAAFQSAIFVFICMTIIAGLYLLSTDQRDGQNTGPQGRGRDSPDSFWKRICPCFFPFSSVASGENALMQSRPRGAPWQNRSPFSNNKLSGRSLPERSSFAGPYPMPFSTLGNNPCNSTTAPPHNQSDNSEELPTIFKQLVMPTGVRLAVPKEPLFEPDFEVDVLALSGVPMLSAALGPDSSNLEIRMHSGAVLAVVTKDMELLRADGSFVGRLVKDRDTSESFQYVLRETIGNVNIDGTFQPEMSGRAILNVNSRGRDGREFTLSSSVSGRMEQRGTAKWRDATAGLPAEHYQIEAHPNVDAVLILACFLGIVVFDIAPHPQVNNRSSNYPPFAANPSAGFPHPGLAASPSAGLNYPALAARPSTGLNYSPVPARPSAGFGSVGNSVLDQRSLHSFTR